jgi:hypothetical protein
MPLPGTIWHGTVRLSAIFIFHTPSYCSHHPCPVLSSMLHKSWHCIVLLVSKDPRQANCLGQIMTPSLTQQHPIVTGDYLIVTGRSPVHQGSRARSRRSIPPLLVACLIAAIHVRASFQLWCSYFSLGSRPTVLQSSSMNSIIE